MNRGEVWWYEHPSAGRRPFVILTRQAAIPVLNQLIAAPCTRTRRGIPTEVDLDANDGMPLSCVVALDSIQVIRPALCVEQITVLETDRMHEI
ncbi:MAG: type II toxin-antitoxin system PemK/MazF family toxin [Acidimicrobiales bacterium]